MTRYEGWATLLGIALAALARSASAEVSVASISDPVLVEPAATLVPGYAEYPSLASDGTQALLAYNTFQSKGRGIGLRLITADGTPVGVPFDLAVEPGDSGYLGPPEVVFDGQSYVVSWLESRMGTPGGVTGVSAPRGRWWEIFS